MRLVYRSPDICLAPTFLSRNGQQGLVPPLLTLQVNFLIKFQSHKCLHRCSRRRLFDAKSVLIELERLSGVRLRIFRRGVIPIKFWDAWKPHLCRFLVMREEKIKVLIWELATARNTTFEIT